MLLLALIKQKHILYMYIMYIVCYYWTLHIFGNARGQEVEDSFPMQLNCVRDYKSYTLNIGI